MAESNFVDYVKICCRSGKGGAGSVHFHRDRHTAKGGPDGGDGGRGGHVILRGNSQLWTLLHLKYRKHVIADPGGNGSSALKHGKDGNDVILEVPLGTVARDEISGEIDFEITEDGQEKVLVPGGRGGLGNNHFKSSTPNTALCATRRARQDLWKVLQSENSCRCRLVFPECRKVNIAFGYYRGRQAGNCRLPFYHTCSQPGNVAHRDYKSFVMADIPGIIEGVPCVEGRGLGLRFLRHIERNAVLLFMIPADSKDIRGEFNILRHELEKYNPELLNKKHVLAITKADLLDQELKEALEGELPDLPHIFISSPTGEGLDKLKDQLWRALQPES
ncbi:MAG: GTPase ObgE [Bacteroidia bacterium]